ncbi:MAG TPA: methionyl-tRNA formyltransferase [Steroidobacteraceae bacterium]|nr:methionyl-tRNA formyltransferase [Steroidobacteraceae bacterium]
MLRVAFAGTPEFALPALAALITHHELIGVLTQPDRPAGRGQKLSFSPVKAAALAAQLPLAQPSSLKDAAGRAQLRAWNPDVLVVVAYGLILPAEVLRLPRLGCVNIHASLLPRWRGAAPIQRAILNGDTESGVSIMQMDAGLDTGPVLLQRRCLISRDHTGGLLHDELSALGAAALLAALDGLGSGLLTPAPQPEEGASYAAKIDKAESRIDWSRAAPDIERQVRAFNPWPVAETTLSGEQLRIFAARADSPPYDAAKVSKSVDPGVIVAIQGDFMRVTCGTGTLAVTEVQLPGRRRVSVRDFSHSRALSGLRLG